MPLTVKQFLLVPSFDSLNICLGGVKVIFLSFLWISRSHPLLDHFLQSSFSLSFFLVCTNCLTSNTLWSSISQHKLKQTQRLQRGEMPLVGDGWFSHTAKETSFFISSIVSLTVELTFGRSRNSKIVPCYHPGFSSRKNDVPGRPKKHSFGKGWTGIAGSTWDFSGLETDSPKQKFLSATFLVRYTKKYTLKINGPAVLDWQTQTSLFRDVNPRWLHVTVVSFSERLKPNSAVMRTTENMKEVICFAVWENHPSSTSGITPPWKHRVALEGKYLRIEFRIKNQIYAPV